MRTIMFFGFAAAVGVIAAACGESNDQATSSTADSSMASSGQGGTVDPSLCVLGEWRPCGCSNGGDGKKQCLDQGNGLIWSKCVNCSDPSTANNSSSTSSSSGGEGGSACIPAPADIVCAGKTCGGGMDGCGGAVICGACEETEVCYNGSCCAPVFSCEGHCNIDGPSDNCGLMGLTCDSLCDGNMFCKQGTTDCLCHGYGKLHPLCADPLRPWLWVCGFPPNSDAVGLGCVPDGTGDAGWCCPHEFNN